MKKILLMTTGGTIVSAETARGLIPALGGEDLLSYLPDMSQVCTLDTIEVSSIDSTNMNPDIWVKLTEIIRNHYGDYDGFVITHGTDTMAYTAAALSYMAQNLEKPVVLTGSQKPITFDSTDARVNLTDSILYAVDSESRGVTIVFNGKVILGTRAKKTMSVSYQAFSSINFPFLATIQNGKIIRYIGQEMPQESPVFCTVLNRNVFLLKLTPLTGPELIEEIFQKNQAVIVESFGAGGLPDRLVDAFAKCLKGKNGEEKVLIITTQVMHEGSHISTYEVGRGLGDKLRCLETRDMNLETALAKIMWILGREPRSYEEIENLFYTPMQLDLLE
jgi:L-asparaginase